MKKVQRTELLDYVTYDEQRPEIRATALIEKEKRRVHLGDDLTFLFENTLTARYQIQEMMRIEKIVKEDSIIHELDTYNGLLGDRGELGCTLLLEYTDEKLRDRMLIELLNLPKHLYVQDASGEKSYAKYDPSQIGEKRLSSVQFLKFSCKGAPVKIGSDHPNLDIVLDFSEAQKEVFTEDLK